MAKKPTIKKTVEKKVKSVEKEVEVIDDIPKRYYVDFYSKHEPIAKDEKIGTIFYSDTTKAIEVEDLAINYSSDIKRLMEGDIKFMDGAAQVWVSRHGTPKDWVLNLHKAENLVFIDPNVHIYASEVTLNNETQ